MKKNLLVLIISIFSFTNVVHAGCTDEMPSETVIFKLPDHSEAEWKEISRLVNKNEGVVEVIPSDQTLQNWSELIAIQYFSSASWKKSDRSLEKILEHLRKTALSSYPENTFTWQIVEKNTDGITYEWILHKPFKNIPVQQEVSRAFLSPSGFHRVGFTKKNELMTAEEREKWVTLLRDNSTVVSFNDERCLEGISMVGKLIGSVSLGANFENWQVIKQLTYEDGSSSICNMPIIQDNSCLAEGLEVVMMPMVKTTSLTQLLETEKQYIQEKAKRKVEFHILEQSPTEIIYHFSYPKEHFQLTDVIRVFLTNHDYYSISYKKALEGAMQIEQILDLKEKLKAITVKTPPNKPHDARKQCR